MDHKRKLCSFLLEIISGTVGKTHALIMHCKSQGSNTENFPAVALKFTFTDDSWTTSVSEILALINNVFFSERISIS